MPARGLALGAEDAASHGVPRRAARGVPRRRHRADASRSAGDDGLVLQHGRARPRRVLGRRRSARGRSSLAPQGAPHDRSLARGARRGQGRLVRRRLVLRPPRRIPLAEVRRIYATAGLELTPAAHERDEGACSRATCRTATASTSTARATSASQPRAHRRDVRRLPRALRHPAREDEAMPDAATTQATASGVGHTNPALAVAHGRARPARATRARSPALDADVRLDGKTALVTGANTRSRQGDRDRSRAPRRARDHGVSQRHPRGRRGESRRRAARRRSRCCRSISRTSTRWSRSRTTLARREGDARSPRLQRRSHAGEGARRRSRASR